MRHSKGTGEGAGVGVGGVCLYLAGGVFSNLGEVFQLDSCSLLSALTFIWCIFYLFSVTYKMLEVELTEPWFGTFRPLCFKNVAKK